MTPKEKAAHLVEKYKNCIHGQPEQILPAAKHCALIAVNELIGSTQFEADILGSVKDYKTTEYWLEVNEEIPLIES